MSDGRAVAIVLGLTLAPVALVLIAAILRGYTIDLHMTRDLKNGFGRRRRPRDDDEA